MSEIRAEAMAQAFWRESLPAVTRVPGVSFLEREWDYEFMDEAEAALDAAVDLLDALGTDWSDELSIGDLILALRAGKGSDE